jgi:FlaA1/EpsC-like NDP-sugar epimerase
MIELLSSHPNAWVHWALFLITIYIVRLLLNMFSLPADSEFVRDRVVLITGGGSGIGRKMALQFARRNAIVVIWDIFEAGMQETVKLVQSAGGRIHSYKVHFCLKVVNDTKVTRPTYLSSPG